LQSFVSLNIHHQCQDINLTSPVHFIHGGKWHAAPDQEIDVNTVMKNYLEFDSGQDILEGALVYRIQRKHAESDRSAQNEAKRIQVLVIWHFEHTKELNVRALLVEHDGELDEHKLRRTYQKSWHLLKEWVNPIKNDWLLDDVAVLTTTVKTMSRGYKWDIFISEGVKNNVKRPLRIDTARWVSIILAIFLALICDISLTPYETMVMTVYNQCPDIELASPSYFCNHGTYYEHPVERTNTV
jgi:hypothetical protein